MVYFWSSLIFAAAQGILLCATVYLLNRNKWYFAVLICAGKIFLYIKGISKLFAAGSAQIIKGVVGYVFGLCMVLLFTVFFIKFSKD